MYFGLLADHVVSPVENLAKAGNTGRKLVTCCCASNRFTSPFAPGTFVGSRPLQSVETSNVGKTSVENRARSAEMFWLSLRLSDPDVCLLHLLRYGHARVFWVCSLEIKIPPIQEDAGISVGLMSSATYSPGALKHFLKPLTTSVWVGRSSTRFLGVDVFCQIHSPSHMICT